MDVGSKLQFNNLTLSPFNFSFNQMLQTSPQTVSVSAPAPPVPGEGDAIYAVSGPSQTFATPAGSSVSSATVSTGQVTRSITNNTGCAVTGFTSSLLDGNNATVFAFPARNLPASATPAVDVVLIDTIPGGVSFSTSMKVDVPVPNFGGCTPTLGAQIATSITFGTMTLSQVTLQNVNESFNQTFNAFAGEPRITAVDTVVVSSGSFSITVQNRLPIADNITVRLNGITKAGAVQQQNIVVPAANGLGGYTSGTLTFDLANATIVPAAVIPQVTGSATATSASITPTNSTNAAVVTGGGSIVVERLVGALNPATTPELSVTTENTDEFTRAQIDFGDFEEPIRLSHLNSATVNLTVVNTAQVPFVLTNFRIGVVRLDAAGQPVRVSGVLDFEKDGAGNPILVSVVDPGQTTLTVARGATKTVALPAALLLDSMVHKLLNNTRVALAVTGGTTIGDGAASRISRTDVIKVQFGLTIGLDITLPPAGVTFRRKQVAGGLDLKQSDADEFSTRLDKATLRAAVVNGTPFGVTVQVSIVKDSSGLTADQIVALPVCSGLPTAGCRVSLVSITVQGGTVNALGQVTTPTNGNIEISMSGSTVRVLFGAKFTTALLVQLVPGTGGGGRGALRPADQMMVNAKAQVDIKSGGG